MAAVAAIQIRLRQCTHLGFGRLLLDTGAALILAGQAATAQARRLAEQEEDDHKAGKFLQGYLPVSALTIIGQIGHPDKRRSRPTVWQAAWCVVGVDGLPWSGRWA